MLTLTFPVGPGELPAYSRAPCFRFCADGTVRSGDHSIAAVHAGGGWLLRHQVYRDWECVGPVLVIARGRAGARVSRHGPGTRVRTLAGALYADDVVLGIRLPTWESGAAEVWREVVLVAVA